MHAKIPMASLQSLSVLVKEARVMSVVGGCVCRSSGTKGIRDMTSTSVNVADTNMLSFADVFNGQFGTPSADERTGVTLR